MSLAGDYYIKKRLKKTLNIWQTNPTYWLQFVATLCQYDMILTANPVCQVKPLNMSNTHSPNDDLIGMDNENKNYTSNIYNEMAQLQSGVAYLWARTCSSGYQCVNGFYMNLTEVAYFFT